jgi:hypothetical protein
VVGYLPGDKVRLLLKNIISRNISFTYLPSDSRTTSGDTSSNPLDISYGNTVVFFLDVTEVNGTNPTLNVYIDIQDPASGKWVNQDKFTTTPITTTGTWAIALPVRSTKYRVRWVIDGINPLFTFSVGVVIVI